MKFSAAGPARSYGRGGQYGSTFARAKASAHGKGGGGAPYVCASEAPDNRMSEAPGTKHRAPGKEAPAPRDRTDLLLPVACPAGGVGGRKALLTNKAILKACKSAASVAAAATCRPAGGRRLGKTKPFGGSGQDKSPSYCPVPGAECLPSSLLRVACCLSSSRSLRLRTGKALWDKDLRVSGPLRNVPLLSGTFQNFPKLSGSFREFPFWGGRFRVEPERSRRGPFRTSWSIGSRPGRSGRR